jgi:hypothetical protein
MTNLLTDDLVYSYSELFSTLISKNPEIPICQRSYIDERIDYFVNKFNKTTNKLPFIGYISCALCPVDTVTDAETTRTRNKLYILDGQHRFYAYKKIYETHGIDLQVPYTIKICTSVTEYVDYFRGLNNNYNLDAIIVTNVDKSNMIKTYIKKRWPNHVSHSENPRYPNINLDALTNFLINRFKNSKDIIKDIDSLNKDTELSIKENPVYSTKPVKQGLCLGFLLLKTESDIRRKVVPSSIRNKLWTNKWLTSTQGFCAVCETEITLFNFHAGHIVSVKNGGTSLISNLDCVCSDCNLSMNVQNMMDYKKKYFVASHDTAITK